MSVSRVTSMLDVGQHFGQHGRPILFLEMRSVKRPRQQFCRALPFDLTFQICQDYRHIAAKFPDDLPACPARRREFIRIRHNGDDVKITLAFRDRLENRHAFRAQRQPVTRVLDIATAENPPGFCSHRSADAELRERRMCVLARLSCRRDQFFFFAHLKSNLIRSIHARRDFWQDSLQ
jgi:hypothetical protein